MHQSKQILINMQAILLLKMSSNLHISIVDKETLPIIYILTWIICLYFEIQNILSIHILRQEAYFSKPKGSGTPEPI